MEAESALVKALPAFLCCVALNAGAIILPMKSLLLVCSLAAFCVVSPMAADECCEQPKVNLQARLREIDLNVLLKQYEAVQTELAKMKVEMALLDTRDDKSSSEIKKVAENRADRMQALKALRSQFVAAMERLASIEVASK